MKTVGEMVVDVIQAQGFDGLCNMDVGCGCNWDDYAPCGGCVCECKPLDTDFICSVFNPGAGKGAAVTPGQSRKECEWMLERSSLMRETMSKIKPEKITNLVAQRDRAKREGNLKLAEEIREQLQKGGVRLRDAEDGTTWIDCD